MSKYSNLRHMIRCIHTHADVTPNSTDLIVFFALQKLYLKAGKKPIWDAPYGNSMTTYSRYAQKVEAGISTYIRLMMRRGAR